MLLIQQLISLDTVILPAPKKLYLPLQETWEEAWWELSAAVGKRVISELLLRWSDHRQRGCGEQVCLSLPTSPGASQAAHVPYCHTPPNLPGHATAGDHSSLWLFQISKKK